MDQVSAQTQIVKVLSGIASKTLILCPDCAGPSFERLSPEMSKDSLSKDNPAQVGCYEIMQALMVAKAVIGSYSHGVHCMLGLVFLGWAPSHPHHTFRRNGNIIVYTLGGCDKTKLRKRMGSDN